VRESWRRSDCASAECQAQKKFRKDILTLGQRRALKLRPMGKLKNDEINTYFSLHLSYRTRILVAHYWMTREPWTVERGDVAWLQACFEASLITGRIYLNALGICRNKRDHLVPTRFREHDVSVEDLGGMLVNLDRLPACDQDLFKGFLKMADKAAAHLTIPMPHPVEDTHIAISRICHYLKVHLFDSAGKPFEGAVPQISP
jgi:hypothetical protein